MLNFPLGLSLTETDDGFLLARKNEDGQVTEFPLSQAETFGLKSKLDLWAAQLLQHAQTKSGSAQAVVSHVVSEVAVGTDALLINLLLTLRTPTGEQVTFSLPAKAGGDLLAQVPVALAQLLDQADPSN